MKPLNLLITNFCNQNCPFCFANKEMQDKSRQREIPLSDLEKLLAKRQDSETIKLLGGEPTIHTQFPKLLQKCARKFKKIQIFTNGIYSREIADLLAIYGEQVAMTYNIMTPGFQGNLPLRQHILGNIQRATEHTMVTLSLTVDPFTSVERLFMLIQPPWSEAINRYRIGLSNPIANQQNFYKFSDFPKVGGVMVELLRKIKQVSPRAGAIFNCGFTRCMFTQEQFNEVSQMGLWRGFGCFGKGGAMDVTTELDAFHCFPLSTTKRFSLREQSVRQVESKLMLQRVTYWKTLSLDTCRKCPFYGHNANQCPGPCIAFLINNQQNSTG